MLAYVYLIVNRLNDRVYVGKTIDPVKRWNDHVYAAKHCDTHLYRSMRKDGVDNFEFRLVSEWPTEEAAFDEERRVIAELKNVGTVLYNETLGGDGILGYRHTDETRQKISAAQRGKPGRNTGRRWKMSEETKRRISEAKFKFYAEKRSGKTLF